MFLETFKCLLTHQYFLNTNGVLGTAPKKNQTLPLSSSSLRSKMREEAPVPLTTGRAKRKCPHAYKKALWNLQMVRDHTQWG